MNCEDVKDEKVIQERLAKINRIFIVLSGKGGVGKSTVAVNLALSFALRGLRTGLLDVDIHGPSVPKMLNLTGKSLQVHNQEILPFECYGRLKVMSMGFFLQNTEQPVIWRGPMKANMIREFFQNVAWGELDVLVVDCPPGTGDEPLTVAQLLAEKSSAVIVTTPQEVATIDVEKCVVFCRQLGLPVAGIVENMSGFVCSHCGEEVNVFSAGGGERLAKQYGVPFLGKIPLDPDIVKSGDEEQPYMYFYSKTKTAERFDEIVERTIQFKRDETPAKESESGKDEPIVSRGRGPEITLSAPTGEVSMKFAVPTTEGKLCAHFGHCEAFALIDTDGDNTITNETYVIPPPHEPGLLPPWLSQQGVNCIIAGGMGSRAKQLFAEQGVSVVIGAQGEYPREIVEHYLQGVLEVGANTCDH
jgi:ATP-binding protein involved in chromosome partitioning